MLDRFLAYLKPFLPLDDAFRARLERDLELVELPRGEHLLRDGQRCDHIGFVLDGLLRAYYLKDGEEICSRFIPENHICFSVIPFYTRRPGYEYLETLEPTTMVRIHYDTLERIYADFPAFNVVTRKWTEHYCGMSEQRLFLLRRQTAEERYQSFLSLYPTILQRVPQKYIASFLGMTTETLSRVRRRWAQGGGTAG